MSSANGLGLPNVAGGVYVLVAGGAAAGLVFFLPLNGLTYAGHGALALLVLAVIIWSSETLSLSVSSLILLLVQPILGILSFEGTLGSFANPIIFLLLGGFIMAEGVTNCGLSTRFAYILASKIGNRRLVLLVTIFATGLLSAGVNNLVAFAIALPVAKEILSLDKGQPAVSGQRNFALNLVLGASYGSLAGGIATELGTGPNLIAATYANISFAKWFTLGFPLSVALMLIIWWVLLRIYPVKADEFRYEKSLMKSKLKELGPITRKEKLALFILLLVIVLLVTAPITAIDAYAVTLIGAVLFFLSGLIDWKHAQRGVNWGVIIFFGAALSVGNALNTTGAANWLIALLTNSIGGSMSPLGIILILMLACAALTQVVSNVGLAAIMVPIVTTLAKHMGLSAATFAVPVAIACSLSFMLPMSDPTIAMAHGSGHVRSREIIKAGLPITLISVVISLLVVLSLLRFAV